jgi:hypothetical protein
MKPVCRRIRNILSELPKEQQHALLASMQLISSFIGVQGSCFAVILMMSEDNSGLRKMSKKRKNTVLFQNQHFQFMHAHMATISPCDIRKAPLASFFHPKSFEATLYTVWFNNPRGNKVEFSAPRFARNTKITESSCVCDTA